MTAADLVALLTSRGETVATAESLTAGLVAARLADVPGASAVLRGGIVAYATELKAALLGVPGEVLTSVGAVSEECARAMAAGARERCGSTWGIACTGVAGPDPQEGHPAGHVCLGLAGPGGVDSRVVALVGDRVEVRSATVDALLGWLLEQLRTGAREVPRGSSG